MNLVKIRDSIKEMPEWVLKTLLRKEKLESVPLFDFNDTHDLTKEEKEHVFDEMCIGGSILPIGAPFEEFAIFRRSPPGAVVPDEPDAIVLVKANEKAMTDLVANKPLLQIAWAVNYKDVNNGVVVVEISYIPGKGIEFGYRIWQDDKWQSEEEIEKKAEVGKMAAKALFSFYIRFIWAVNAPQSVVLKSSPKVAKDCPRSVQWVKSREHYTIVNHSDAVVMRQSKRSLSDKEISRGAHYRKAHLRKLVSDKFVHMKGKTVKVKRAWVGPVEWEGTDKKVYRVVCKEPKKS